MKFIDVSNHNGDINWTQVKSSGIETVIIKATEGTTFQDPFREKHYSGAKAAGLAIGFYHFLSFTSAPETQAENFWNQIKNKSIDIKPVLDVETQNSNAMNYITRFINKFTSLSNLPMMIYSGRIYIETYLEEQFCNNNYFWVAEYGVNAPKNVPKCGTWTAWQYTETGIVSGVNGYCDLNEIYELENFFLNKKPPTPTPQPVVDTRIIEIQRICNQYGFNVPENNVWDSQTHIAVSKLPLAYLWSNTSSLNKYIQRRLKITEDGIFGTNTRNSVLNYQRSKELLQDGIVGFDTLTEMILH